MVRSEAERKEIDDQWKKEDRERLQAEGVLGKRHLLDPVRTALCLSHQRALHQFLESAKRSGGGTDVPLGVIFEDDTRPGEALSTLDPELGLEIPDDSEVIFLHDRSWRRGSSGQYENWRIVRGGIGLEAYAVTPTGAKKMLSAFRPVVEECDVQLMTFMEGYADLEKKNAIWEKLRGEGHSSFPSIRGYAPVRPYFQTDHWMSSVKFATMEEGCIRAN